MDHLVWGGLHRPVADLPEGDQLALDLTERSDGEPMPLPDGLDELEISRW